MGVKVRGLGNRGWVGCEELRLGRIGWRWGRGVGDGVVEVRYTGRGERGVGGGLGGGGRGGW